MAIDESGCLWVAAIGSGKLIRVTPNGEEDQVSEGPEDWTSSVCFGGVDRRDLYAVTFGGEPYDTSIRRRVPGPSRRSRCCCASSEGLMTMAVYTLTRHLTPVTSRRWAFAAGSTGLHR